MLLCRLPNQGNLVYWHLPDSGRKVKFSKIPENLHSFTKYPNAFDLNFEMSKVHQSDFSSYDIRISVSRVR